jgi:rSAM/selenodomain-associated transferase 1
MTEKTGGEGHVDSPADPGSKRTRNPTAGSDGGGALESRSLQEDDSSVTARVYQLAKRRVKPTIGGRVLGVFAKRPEPGLVKTRLGAATSPEWAARVAAAFLADLLDRLAEVDADRVVAFAPDEHADSFAALAQDRYDLVPQGPGDLGARLARFFAARFEEGARAVVVVGTDSPTLPVEWIGRALDELSRANVVLGPATDGGYYLLGLSRPLPSLFEGVDWGTERVLRQTVERLGDATLVLLPPWYDVDGPADWEVLAGHVAALRRAGINPNVPRTERLLAGEPAT